MRVLCLSWSVRFLVLWMLGSIAAGAPQTMTAAQVAPGQQAFAPTPHGSVHIRAAVVGEPVVGNLVRLRVRVNHDQGRDVSVRLLNPPPGLVFPPARSSTSPLLLDLEWRLHTASGGRTTLVFQGTDGVTSTRHTLTVDTLGGKSSAVQWGDVTGDGQLDMVVGASGNDGAVHVWSGSSAPGSAPVATLTAPLNQLGRGDLALQLADLDLDGTLDIVVGGWLETPAPVSGALFIWMGGADLGTASGPDAILSAPSPEGGGLYGPARFIDLTGDGREELVAITKQEVLVWDLSQGLTGAVAPTCTLEVNGFTLFTLSSPVIEDVTGDGINDVLARGTDNGGTFGVFLWKGAAALAGVKAQDALWSVPSLGLDSLQVADVTGDGILDILAGGYPELLIWAGDAGLTSASAPTASLSGPAGDPFGFGVPLRPADITADGILDVIIPAYQAQVGGVIEAGAIHVWPGGTGLTGSLTPQIRMTVGTAAFYKQGVGGRVYVRDWNGDGIPDLVSAARANNAPSGQSAQKLFVFAGAAGLSGDQLPLAELSVTGVATPGMLGNATGPALLFGDVTGDGFMDCLTGAADANIGNHTNAGRIYVFAGGPAAVGVQGPTAMLRVKPGSDDDFLGEFSPWLTSGARQALHLVDLTGDGVLDVVAGSDQFDRGVQTDNGGCFVWAGGPGLTGSVGTTAKLFSGGGSQTLVGKLQGNSMRFADLTGDGYLDLLSGSAVASWLDGELYLWAGGPTLGGTQSPVATLVRSIQGEYDQLGTLSGQALHIADLTGDGALDVVSGSWWADLGSLVDPGLLYIWGGAGGLGPGSSQELGVFSAPGAQAQDRLGDF